MEDPRYPIGPLTRVETLTDEQRRACIDAIRATPGNLARAVEGLDDEQLDTPYREGGWTVRQVVHHLPDSHMNAFIRIRFALTEEEPTIKPYDEASWARLADARLPVEVSLTLLDALHRRLVPLMESFGDAEWRRTLRHPDLGVLTLDAMAQIYSWHGRHHVAHITTLRERMGWS